MATARAAAPAATDIARGVRAIVVALILGLGAGQPGPARGAGVAATMHLSATVPAVLHLRVVAMPVTAVVSAADIRRGHVELPQPLILAVRTNLATPYRVAVSPARAAVAAVEIVADTASQVGSDGRTQWQHLRAVAPMEEEVIRMNLRIILAPDAEPGDLGAPVRVALLPS